MRALIVSDMQYDFMPDGALPVEGGYEIVPTINDLLVEFGVAVATQDWHPPDHGSFASNHDEYEPGDVGELKGVEQVMWPDHCVQGTRGAEFIDEIETRRYEAIFRKGTDPTVDSYSCFYDNAHQRTTGLAGYLREKGVEDVYICGVATDYCVKFTALDALEEGFETHVIIDASRGIDQKEGDIDRAVAEMRDKGAHILRSEELL